VGRREGEGREIKRKKQIKNNTLNRINSNLPGESIARERESIVFVNREKHPLLQKIIQGIEKRKERHNTQKIIKI